MVSLVLCPVSWCLGQSASCPLTSLLGSATRGPPRECVTKLRRKWQAAFLPERHQGMTGSVGELLLSAPTQLLHPPCFRKETREVWESSGAENPSFNTVDVSLTSIYSFTDDLGYQGSQDLTSEEDPSLDRAKSQKRNKVAIVRMRRNKVREADENDDDEEDEAERSPGVRRKRHSYSKTRQQRQKEHLSILEGSLSTPTSKTKSSRWSMTEFRQYLCMCCHDKQKSMEENKASDSKESRDPNENEDGVTGSINK
ncbi:uncharacterized protein AAG666_014885 [Megaptera novaeangliae]